MVEGDRNVPDEESALGDSHRVVSRGHQGVGLEFVLRGKCEMTPLHHY